MINIVAYGKICFENCVFRVPSGIFVDLCGAPRNDVNSAEIAEYIFSKLSPILYDDIAVEVGGDSLTYLTIDDRLAVTEKFNREKSCFCVLFECDFAAVMYAEELGVPLFPAFNDGKEYFEIIISVDLSKI